jgi:hypothetical protein
MWDEAVVPWWWPLAVTMTARASILAPVNHAWEFGNGIPESVALSR